MDKHRNPFDGHSQIRAGPNLAQNHKFFLLVAYAGLVFVLSSCGLLAELDIIPAITVEPATVSMRSGQSWTFTAEVPGDSGVTWEVSRGELTVNGDRATYMPPPGVIGDITLVARSAKDPSKTATSTITILDDSSQELAIHSSGRFVRLIVDQLPESAGFSAITKQLYETFEDDFDFIVIFRHGIPNICGIGQFINNSVSGIGRVPAASVSEYGSGGRLLGVPFVGIDYQDAKPGFYFPTRLVAQSMMKVWGNWIIAPNPYWGFSSAAGLMGGFDRTTLEDLGDGEYRATADPEADSFSTGPWHRPFSEIELYLMGLIPPEDVPPLLVAEGAAWINGETGVFSAESFVELTIDDIIADNGPRTPAYGDAPNAFRALFVITTEAPLTPDFLAGMDKGLEVFSSVLEEDAEQWTRLRSFNWLTSGKATVQTDGLFDALR